MPRIRKEMEKNKNSGDFTNFKECKQTCNQLVLRTKKKYFCELIENDANTKSLFKIVDKINKKSSSIPLSQHNNPKELADDFGKFFETKIDKIHEHFIDNDECLDYDIPFQSSALERTFHYYLKLSSRKL